MHKLPKLPYSYNALEPFIDAKTMEIHHTKHHQGYVDNLNKALSEKPSLLKLSADELLKNLKLLPNKIKQTVINNAGGHVNHSFFWKIMLPADKFSNPSRNLESVLSEEFGSVENFKEKFSEKAMSVFGSGWCFLILAKNKKLMLKRHSFQNSPISSGNTPILGIDVWEHAYYLKYQNRRADYIKAWWNVFNWRQVEINLNLTQ